MNLTRKFSVLFQVFSLLNLALSVGCTSIRTNSLSSDANGNWYGGIHYSSNKGVPCKLKIQKGIRVNVFEQVAIFSDGETSVLTESGSKSKAILSIKREPIMKDVFFMVHIPRPLAGTLEIGSGDNPGYEFNDEGYLVGLGAKVEDTTVKDVAGIVKAFSPFSLGGQKSFEAEEKKAEYVIKERLVATKDFYWDDPNWDAAMNQWLCGIEANILTCQSEVDNVSIRTSDKAVKAKIR